MEEEEEEDECGIVRNTRVARRSPLHNKINALFKRSFDSSLINLPTGNEDFNLLQRGKHTAFPNVILGRSQLVGLFNEWRLHETGFESI